MAIQILGLRDYTDTKKGITKKYDAFFKEGWRADSVEDIFTRAEELLVRIPEKERYNIYFTVADCFEEKGRKLKEQHVIPFDIDKLAGDTDEDVIHQAELAARAACEALGIHYEQTGVIFSGNGVQLFVRIAYPILSDDYFEATRPHYAELCRRIQSKLLELGVSGEIDTSVFSAARLMRFPLTYNVKPGKPKRIAKILQKKIEIQNFYIEQLSGLDELQGPEQIRMDVIKNYPEPDARAVQDGCEFLKHCFVNPAKISEPQWYAAASIVPRLYKDEDKGKALFHEMSAGHPSYNFYETELKAEQALLNAGPRTCKNIDTLWDGCKTCPHFGTDLVSPILIHGPDYIKSKDFGFREMREDKNGNLISGKPAYDDLIKQFEKENKFVSIIEENCIYTFIDTHWREYLKTELFIWMTDKVVPRPSGAEMKEFYDRIRARNGRRNDWFIGSTEGKMNFQNGILNINTLEMSPHDPELGFTHVLPYNYDKNAECPKYDKFMSEVIDDPEVVRVLNEFAGYAIAGGECLAQKALVLLGVGSNGKTVFAETIAKVVGDKNFSALLISALNNDQMRAILQNKLFNFSDEASLYSLRDSSDFKSLVTGGFTTAKVVYKAPSIFKNKAKFIVLTNELPKAYDTSEGYFRRLILVDFNKKFEGANDNKNIRSEIWAELPGICRKYVMAYKDLRDRKFSFDEPQTIKDAVEAYREESNNVALFFSEEVEITDSPDDRVPLPEVYSKYQSWCVAAGEKPKERGMFTSAAKKLKKLSHCDVSKVIKENGKFIRVITNIKYLGEF